MEPRQRLINQVARSVRDERVLAAIARVPRDRFVLVDDESVAWVDAPLTIGFGQTISQPTMVGLMLEALKLDGTEHVLEIGAGSGYQAALLSELCASVVTTEVIPQLAERAADVLTDLGITNVTVRTVTTELGAPDLGPYDAIVVAAAAPAVPSALLDQLKVGGRLAIPVGSRLSQELQVITATEAGFTVEHHGACRFVPLVGPAGFEERP